MHRSGRGDDGGGGFFGLGKAGRGQPPHTPTDQTRQLVEMMSECGIPQMQIAPMVGISDETLRKYYRRNWPWA